MDGWNLYKIYYNHDSKFCFEHNTFLFIWLNNSIMNEKYSSEFPNFLRNLDFMKLNNHAEVLQR